MAASFVSGTAALIFSKDTALTPASVFNQILNSSQNIDLINPGYAGSLGVGRLNAFRAISNTPVPLLTVSQTKVHTTAVGVSSGVLHAGDTASVFVTLYNSGTSVSNVSAALLTSDSLVQSMQAISSYGTIGARDTSSNQTSFRFAVSSIVQNNRLVAFRLAVTSTSGFADTLAFGLPLQAEFNLSGLISSNTVLTGDKVYIVTGNILVNNGVTLTIQPGATLRFDSAKVLQVNGTLIARGTRDSIITFTSNQASPMPGDWGDIFFTDASTDATFDSNGNYTGGCILEYVSTMYGGDSLASMIATIRGDHCNLAIFNSDISESRTSGIAMDGGSLFIRNCNIHDNAGSGVAFLSTNYSTGQLQLLNCTVTGNGNFGIGDSRNDSLSISNSTIARNSNIGIYLSEAGPQGLISNCNIANNYQGIFLWASGCSIEKDTISTNSDVGIRFGSYGDNLTIANDIIENNGGAFSVGWGGNYVITNNIIEGNKRSQCSILQFEPFGNDASSYTYAWTNNLFFENSSDSASGIGIFVHNNPNQSITFANNNFVGNKVNYILSDEQPSSSSAINAENNWWGTTSDAAIQKSIYDFNDNGNFGFVEYSPFLTAPSSASPGFLYMLTANPPSPVGVQPDTITLNFSRAMDTTFTPTIDLIDSSGASYPVNENRHWIDSSRFRATINVDEMFRDGSYVVEVKGGKDKMGFGTPRDTTNRLAVYTVGSAARELRASTQTRNVRLSWNPASILNLLGYNVYRSSNSGKSYQRINKAIVADTVLVDSSLSTTGTYYYVYTIVDGSFRESGYSNAASLTVTSVSQRQQIPTSYALYQNYPNPFNPSTTVRFDLKEASTVTLEVYNILGQRVSQQTYGTLGAGRYNEVVNMDRFASGVYYYRINVVGNDGQKFVSMKKLVLMK